MKIVSQTMRLAWTIRVRRRWCDDSWDESSVRLFVMRNDLNTFIFVFIAIKYIASQAAS